MTNYSLEAVDLNKTFGRRLIFKHINFRFEEKGIFGIAGSNGSGKSTLVKIIGGVISPSEGKMIHRSNGKEIEIEKLHNYIGFVSPYLVMYEEFSAWENLMHFSRIRGINFNEEKVEFLLNHLLISNRKDDFVKTYSSGMKQRLKFVFALMHSPQILILDEPTSNLDEEGKSSVYELIRKEGEKNIVIIASNEQQDLSHCYEIIDLMKHKEI